MNKLTLLMLGLLLLLLAGAAFGATFNLGVVNDGSLSDWYAKEGYSDVQSDDGDSSYIHITRDDCTAEYVLAIYFTGSALYNSPSKATTTSYATHTWELTTNPETSQAWQWSELDDFEIGVGDCVATNFMTFVIEWSGSYSETINSVTIKAVTKHSYAAGDYTYYTTHIYCTVDYTEATPTPTPNCVDLKPIEDGAEFLTWVRSDLGKDYYEHLTSSNGDTDYVYTSYTLGYIFIVFDGTEDQYDRWADNSSVKTYYTTLSSDNLTSNPLTVSGWEWADISSNYFGFIKGSDAIYFKMETPSTSIRNSKINSVDFIIERRKAGENERVTSFVLRVHYSPYWNHKFNGVPFFNVRNINGVPKANVQSINGVPKR